MRGDTVHLTGAGNQTSLQVSILMASSATHGELGGSRAWSSVPNFSRATFSVLPSVGSAARAEQPTGNAYAEWLAAQNETYSQVGLKRLVAAFPECDCSTAPPTPSNHKEAIWRLAVDVRWNDQRS